jgi:cytochrome c oxidase subunit 2
VAARGALGEGRMTPAVLLVLQLFPEAASTSASKVDHLYVFLLLLSGFFGILIATLLVTFAIRFRHNAAHRYDAAKHADQRLEIVWTVVPFVIAMVIFGWGASLYFHLTRAPKDAIEIQVVAKRWMWKLQHLNGRREINELHVPVGRPVLLKMTSEDVIHSFYVPAFRVKMDVLPRRYTTLWFEPSKPGKYHLFCAEYCGTKHSQMGGWVYVMEPAQFEAWLSGGSSTVSVADAGAGLFRGLGCATCHSSESGARGPDLGGLYGTTVHLEGGGTATADDAYLRESILNPKAKIVAGYQPLMPTFGGLVGEEGLLQLIEYLKSIGPKEGKTLARAEEGKARP